MRDRLIHAYFGIDYDIVWDVVINKIYQDCDRMLKKSCEMRKIAKAK